MCPHDLAAAQHACWRLALQELGNYAEYSGAPSTAETYVFAKTLLNWCAVRVCCCSALPQKKSPTWMSTVWAFGIRCSG